MSHQHRQQFEEMRKRLAAIGSKEGNFIKVELLFYDAITVARQYGGDEKENHLLAALKQLQANQYQQTKALFRKSTQREKVIGRFINELKNILTAGVKDAYFHPQLS